jgi:hypothetical protein
MQLTLDLQVKGQLKWGLQQCGEEDMKPSHPSPPKVPEAVQGNNALKSLMEMREATTPGPVAMVPRPPLTHRPSHSANRPASPPLQDRMLAPDPNPTWELEWPTPRPQARPTMSGEGRMP